MSTKTVQSLDKLRADLTQLPRWCFSTTVATSDQLTPKFPDTASSMEDMRLRRFMEYLNTCSCFDFFFFFASYFSTKLKCISYKFVQYFMFLISYKTTYKSTSCSIMFMSAAIACEVTALVFLCYKKIKTRINSRALHNLFLILSDCNNGRTQSLNWTWNQNIRCLCIKLQRNIRKSTVLLVR